MPCFCTVPADAARSHFNVGALPILPPPPSLRLVAALPAFESRLDVQMAAYMDDMRLPKIDFGGGPLAQMAMSLSMMVGTFALDDLPMLEFQMEQAAVSLERNVWPRLGWLAQLKIQPLLTFALTARLVLDLQAMGVDPFDMSTVPPTPFNPSTRFAMNRPKLAMARFLAGLPPLMNLAAAFDIPSLGDTGAMSALSNRLNGLASLAPPKLLIPMPMLTKLALVLESLATIESAFGDAFSPYTWSRIDAMLKMWRTLPIPFALPMLALETKLASLPALEDVQLGERIAGRSFSTFATPFSPPRLAIAPFLNVSMALHASLQFALDMEPFDMCAMCDC